MSTNSNHEKPRRQRPTTGETRAVTLRVLAWILPAAGAIWLCLTVLSPPGGLLGAARGADPAAAPANPAPVLAGEEPQMAEKKGEMFAFVGVKGCKKCHMRQTGDQYRTWEKGPHAKALETLKGDEAKKLGAERGIADPSQAPECLRCHVTGYGLDKKLTAKIDMDDGVGCESCHGAGDKYTDKEIHTDREMAAKAGMTQISEQTCRKCHNQDSPSYKEFNFEERVKKIAHPIPDDKRKKTTKK